MSPFTPIGPTVSVTANTPTPGSVQVLPGDVIGSQGEYQLRVVNPVGNPMVFLKFGGSAVAAAATDIPMLPGTIEVFSLSSAQQFMSALSATGSGTVYATLGRGE